MGPNAYRPKAKSYINPGTCNPYPSLGRAAERRCILLKRLGREGLMVRFGGSFQRLLQGPCTIGRESLEFQGSRVAAVSEDKLAVQGTLSWLALSTVLRCCSNLTRDPLVRLARKLLKGGLTQQNIARFSFSFRVQTLRTQTDRDTHTHTCN